MSGNNKDFKVKNGIQPTVYHEAVGTVTSGSENYAFSAGSFSDKSLNVSSQSTASTDMFFKPDGTKVYIGKASVIYQYDLSTAFDLSTASYASKSFSYSSQSTSAPSLTFKSDGSKMYVEAAGTAYQYSLSTAWDVSTASYDSKSLNVNSQDTGTSGIAFKADGTKFYTVGTTNDNINQYGLTTAWDISTGSYDNINADLSTNAANPTGLFFKSDGTQLHIASQTEDALVKYTLSTAWDLSTLSFDSSFSVSAQDDNVHGMATDSTGSRAYMLGRTSPNTIYQYSTVLYTKTLDLSTGSVFEITPTSDIQINLSNPADSGTVSQATLLLDGVASTTYDIANASHYGNMSIETQLTSPEGMEISSDGTKIYVVGRTTDKVFEYVLSTPWDVTTGSYNSVEFSVLSQTTYPTDIAFKPDGTKMYICTSNEDKVFQYSLSTAWDLSTASYDSVSFDTSDEENNVQALAFSNDGTKMYTAGLEFDDVVEYDLSTAWDVSTASHNSVTLSTSSQTTTPDGLFFNADGTSLFLVSGGSDLVYQYDMTTAFDLSTASYTLASSSLYPNANTAKGGRFDNTGTRMYIVDRNADNVTQWTVGSEATITYDSTLQFGGGTAPDSPAIGETDVLTFSTTDGGTSYQAVQAIDGAS